MLSEILHPPRVPTEQLRLESFKTLSRLQLILEFRPWLEFSKDHVKRSVESPYFLLWDCLCFGAPLNTLLEMLGSPTPRHLAASFYDFDFDLPRPQREAYFASFIQRVQALEMQGRVSFGEVLRVEDFTGGLNASFARILRTVNRVLAGLHACYPGVYSVAKGSAARRVSLIQQLVERERVYAAKLASTADLSGELYEHPAAAHPSLEGFLINCSRLIPYHEHVLKSLEHADAAPGTEDWDSIFAYQNKVFFTRMTASYRSLCANYLTFQKYFNDANLEETTKKCSGTVLRNISDIITRFSEYHDFLLAILDTTAPSDGNSYDSLCTITFEARAIADSLVEIGRELRTMASFHLLASRFNSINPLDYEPGPGNLIHDDCLLVDPYSGQWFSVFLFERMLLCCTDSRRSDIGANIGDIRYPVRPWETGPALMQKHPLNVLLSIPTVHLTALHCIDAAYFEITWGSDSGGCITFYPVVHHQYTQWTTLLEPFVSRVYHSTSVPHYLQDTDGASVHSGMSLLVTEDEQKYGLRHRSSARPWSVIGRKGTYSSSSSMIGAETSDKASILSPGLLPTLFLNNLPRSPLHMSFAPDDAIPSMHLLVDSPVEDPGLGVNGELTPVSLPDLTKDVVKQGQFPVAHGGYSDIWRATWKRDQCEVQVAVKALRLTTNDPATKEKLIKRLHDELRIWNQLVHPNVLELCGTVSNFGPYVSMVCPWLKNGSITKYLEKSGDLLSVEDRLKLISEVADGLAYLHSCSVVHGDLTGSNVLIDDELHARLCDFGLSTLLLEECQDVISVQSVYTSHLGGSVRWADAYLFRSFDDESPPIVGTPNDIYSFGSIMLEILSGRMPYHYLRTDAQVVIQLHQGIRPRRPASTFIDDDQWDLIQRCWKEPPEDRPNADEVLLSIQNLVLPWQRLHSS